MQTTKRCHWVPQSYLRAFAADGQHRKKIWRFSHTIGGPELKRIDKVAVKFHLYARLKPTGRYDDDLEKKLAKLENWFASPLWKATCTEFPDFREKPLRQMLALLVAVTYLRNPRAYSHVQQLHRNMVAYYSQFPTLPEEVEINGRVVKIDNSSWPAYRDATEEDVKASWHAEINRAAWMAEEFLKMRWAVLFAEQPSFITSDNPVLFLHPGDQFRGIKDPETTIAFPLSPTRVLMMDNRHSEPDSNYYPVQGDASGMNLLTWRNAIDHMFSFEHPDLICSQMTRDAEQQGYTWSNGRGWHKGQD